MSGDSPRSRILFPGRQEDFLFKDVLPLLLKIANDGYKQNPKSRKSFEELYLDWINPKYQPRVFDGACELSLDHEDAVDIRVLSSRELPSFHGWEGWKAKRTKGVTYGKGRALP